MRIELLIVEDHERYAGRRAVLHESDRSLFITIVKTGRAAAVVRHRDGELQKVLWGRLSVEMREEDE